jgi:hypothetical protein
MLMNYPKIIAVCGYKRTGKDTVANILCKKYNYINIKIAEDLKHIIKYLFNLSEEQVETNIKDQVDERWGVSPRKIMQYFGTELMQDKLSRLIPNIGNNFWINRLIDKYIKCYPDKHFVISDLRFVHEYKCLEQYNPIIVKIERKLHELNIDKHSSENDFNKIPVSIILKNNRCINNLEIEIDKLMEKFK